MHLETIDYYAEDATEFEYHRRNAEHGRNNKIFVHWMHPPAAECNSSCEAWVNGLRYRDQEDLRYMRAEAGRMMRTQWIDSGGGYPPSYAVPNSDGTKVRGFNSREEHTMQAGYNVAKLIEKAKEKRAEQAELLKSFNTWMREELVKAFENEETHPDDNIVQRLRHQWLEENNLFTQHISHKALIKEYDRLIEKLELLDDESVQLSDDEFKRMRL